MPWSRIFSGIVAIVLALGMILLGGWYFTLGFGILICLGQVEYFQLVRATGTAPASKTTLIVSQALLIISTLSAVLADAVLPVAGTFICFYLLFQPKLATIADISHLYFRSFLWWLLAQLLGAIALPRHNRSQQSPLRGILARTVDKSANVTFGSHPYPISLRLYLGS